MAFDVKTVTELTRARIGVPDASANVRIIWAIPHALERLARKVAANPKKRPLLTMKRDDQVIEVPDPVDGIIDLADVESRVLLEFIDYGELWYSGSDVSDASGAKKSPMQRLKPSEALRYASHPMAGSYVFYTLEGSILRVLPFNTGTTILTGDVIFCVPFVPTLEELDAIPELHDDFIDKVIELVVSPESDAALDGEH